MKGIVALCLFAVLAGCSAIKLTPKESSAVEYRTPVKGVTAQLVLPQDFQRLVITQKPSYGKAWGPRQFEVVVGRPLSQAIANDLRSRIPAIRIGDRDDGAQSDIVITPKIVALEFGVDDGRATGLMAGFGVLAAGSDTVVGAKVTVRGSILERDRSVTDIEVVGGGEITIPYLSINESDVSKAIGAAIDDAAQKIGEEVIKRALLTSR